MSYEILITEFDGRQYIHPVKMTLDEFDQFAQRHIGQDCEDAEVLI